MMTSILNANAARYLVTSWAFMVAQPVVVILVLLRGFAAPAWIMAFYLKR
jgi:hypothetical protein